MSSCSGVTKPQEEPPSWMALSFLPSLTPPPKPSITSRSVAFVGTSTQTLLVTSPDMHISFVPGYFSLPMAPNQSAPFVMISGMTAKVSTLLTIVGFLCRPATAMEGGLSLGSPRTPSREFTIAVPSPQTYAPAPETTLMTVSPQRPLSSACLTALRRRRIEFSYSPRT